MLGWGGCWVGADVGLGRMGRGLYVKVCRHLRVQCVDNLEACSISSGTGLLIPSAYDSCAPRGREGVLRISVRQ
jgi:hypothetical protein